MMKPVKSTRGVDFALVRVRQVIASEIAERAARRDASLAAAAWSQRACRG
jgi:hypothetical protein